MHETLGALLICVVVGQRLPSSWSQGTDLPSLERLSTAKDLSNSILGINNQLRRLSNVGSTHPNKLEEPPMKGGLSS